MSMSSPSICCPTGKACRRPRLAAISSQRAYNDVQQEFPDKPIIIGEAGWPSEGRTSGCAEASLANEAYFMRAFVQLAMEKGYDYYLLEAYDQPWKGGNEGVGRRYLGPLRRARQSEIRLHRHAAHLSRNGAPMRCLPRS